MVSESNCVMTIAHRHLHLIPKKKNVTKFSKAIQLAKGLVFSYY
jgi:diadenosine tetraphosphate (Ap4A) HIT family hydrolase